MQLTLAEPPQDASYSGVRRDSKGVRSVNETTSEGHVTSSYKGSDYNNAIIYCISVWLCRTIRGQEGHGLTPVWR